MGVEKLCLIFFIEKIVDVSREDDKFAYKTYEIFKDKFGFLEEGDKEFQDLEMLQKIMKYATDIKRIALRKAGTYEEILNFIQPLIDYLIENKYLHSKIAETTEELFSYFDARQIPIKDTTVVAEESVRVRIDTIFDGLSKELKTRTFDLYLEEIAFPIDVENQGHYMRNCGISDIIISHIKLCFLGQIIYQVLRDEGLENITITKPHIYIDYIESKIKIAIHRLFCRSFI